MIFCSIHTHSVHCDGKNTLEEMARGAFAAGAVTFGASGHSHTDIPYDEGTVMVADPVDYRREVLALREEYAGRMDVLLGIEQDSCSNQPVPDWAEYWIGSVHNLRDPATGEYHCLDWDGEHLALACRDMAGGDFMTLAELYYRDVAAVAVQRPTILGHIDLIVKVNQDGRYFDETAPRYRRAALDALHTADPAQTLIEINTGAVARGYRKEPYPALFLLREWRSMGGRVIFTADAHSVNGIAWGYDQAVELARAAGFARHTILRRGGQEEVPL